MNASNFPAGFSVRLCDMTDKVSQCFTSLLWWLHNSVSTCPCDHFEKITAPTVYRVLDWIANVCVYGYMLRLFYQLSRLQDISPASLDRFTLFSFHMITLANSAFVTSSDPCDSFFGSMCYAPVPQHYGRSFMRVVLPVYAAIHLSAAQDSNFLGILWAENRPSEGLLLIIPFSLYLSSLSTSLYWCISIL